METNQKTSFFQSGTAKIIMVGLLTLILLIPLEFVKGLIKERAQRQQEVVEEINDKWGRHVYLYGPMLKVPYTVYEEESLIDEKTKQVVTKRSPKTEYAYFFPEELKSDIKVNTEEKSRNNYQSVIFKSDINIKGSFIKPDISNRDIPSENMQWDKASIIIRTNNIKGIKGEVSINFGSNKYTFEPVAINNGKDSTSSLATLPIDAGALLQNNTAPFTMAISYNGSRNIAFVPVGKITEASMVSNWHSPSFGGNFLPENKTITEKGFTADWKISYLNRPFPQQHFDGLPDLSEFSFNVDFMIPVDQYLQNERASKYGFLVIGLTFLIFFLIQAISKISIHIFQYTMIGLALIMFYTLLISITEHSSFTLAYIIAGCSVVAMIGLYSISILKNIKFPVFIAASLSALYTFIYVIIQLENYALLVGSIGLFLILGAVMYFSRKIDWGTN
ncbi:cell envelope integrity protein CreD [Flavobacterium sp. MK4S-17]|uniref:cell envelope integrity protein CreD n=1 Tax=Flavobacterium sp. MK4S-17 TaxID=2543737 RepID=UPI001359DDB6|nr:cell envelope integrity protein CreD [Flavobacterium sp. MK4S-17]